MNLGKLLERVLHLVPVLLGVSVIVFLMMAVTPGDPVEIMLGDQQATPGAATGACARTWAWTCRCRSDSATS